MPPILLHLTHTCHVPARTGIQRVAAGLWRELGARAQGVCHDPYLNAWRAIQNWESANLSPEPAGGRGLRGSSRSQRWPLRARLRGWLRRRRRGGFDGNLPPGDCAFLCPELFSAKTARALPQILALARGPRAAIFFDATPLKVPEFMPPRMVGRFPAYMRELLAFDGVAAISADARESLVGYWRWMGARNPPPVTAIPLGVKGVMSRLLRSDDRNKRDMTPSILSVGTIEGRKNHLALLDACEALWSRGMRFDLRLIGMARPETAGPALRKVAMLRAAGRPLRHDTLADDAALDAAYAECAFTVYPSLIEGFGLPVAESLARGKPCICSGRGALGELAAGGGCLTLDSVDSTSLADAVARLLLEPAERARLAAQAGSRPVRTEADYARDIAAWISQVERRP